MAQYAEEHRMEPSEATYYQRALVTYRNLLSAYLREYQRWGTADIPPMVVVGISNLRREIMHVKGLLRSHTIPVSDADIDDGTLDERAQEIAHQRELLKIHRRRLASLLHQRAGFSSPNVPTHLDVELAEVRQEIRQIKAILQNWGVMTDDLPPEQTPATQA
jgi:hypothetical protein